MDATTLTFRTPLTRDVLEARLREAALACDAEVRVVKISIDEPSPGFPSDVDLDDRRSPVTVVHGPSFGAVALSTGTRWEASVPGDGDVWSVTSAGDEASDVVATVVSAMVDERLEIPADFDPAPSTGEFAVVGAAVTDSCGAVDDRKAAPFVKRSKYNFPPPTRSVVPQPVPEPVVTGAPLTDTVPATGRLPDDDVIATLRAPYDVPPGTVVLLAHTGEAHDDALKWHGRHACPNYPYCQDHAPRRIRPARANRKQQRRELIFAGLRDVAAALAERGVLAALTTDHRGTDLAQVLGLGAGWSQGSWVVLVLDDAHSWQPVLSGAHPVQSTDVGRIVTHSRDAAAAYSGAAAPDAALLLRGFAPPPAPAEVVVDCGHRDDVWVRASDLAAARDALAEATARADDAQSGLAAATDRAARLAVEVDDLRRRNAELARELEEALGLVVEPETISGEIEAVHSDVVPEQVPDRLPRPEHVTTVARAIEEAKRSLPGLIVTSSAVRSAHTLDVYTADQDLWSRRIWEQLVEMTAILAARRGGWTGSMGDWVRGPRCGVPVNQFAAGESETVMTTHRLRELRTFDVPGFGPLEAAAHWRIASGRAPSPRMHVVDLGAQIAVVYAGPHRPNASSN